MTTSTTPARELLPCPFCGMRARLFSMCTENFAVVCLTCEAEGPTRRTGSEAIDGWNNRALIKHSGAPC